MINRPKLPTLNLPTLPLWARTRQGMVLTATFVVALVVGLTVLAGSVFFSAEDIPEHELTVRDVRVTSFSPGTDNQINAVVDMSWSKMGAPARDCVAQLMLKSGKLYRHGTSDKQTVTMAVEGPQKITLDLPFRFPRDEYAKAGKIRVLCASSTGSRWVSFALPEWTP
jgi:hypothetical protein